MNNDDIDMYLKSCNCLRDSEIDIWKANCIECLATSKIYSIKPQDIIELSKEILTKLAHFRLLYFERFLKIIKKLNRSEKKIFFSIEPKRLFKGFSLENSKNIVLLVNANVPYTTFPFIWMLNFNDSNLYSWYVDYVEDFTSNFFEDLSVNELYCSICKDNKNIDICTLCCGHHMCNICLDNITTCPFCRKMIKKPVLANTSIKSILLQLENITTSSSRKLLTYLEKIEVINQNLAFLVLYNYVNFSNVEFVLANMIEKSLLLHSRYTVYSIEILCNVINKKQLKISFDSLLHKLVEANIQDTYNLQFLCLYIKQIFSDKQVKILKIFLKGCYIQEHSQFLSNPIP